MSDFGKVLRAVAVLAVAVGLGVVCAWLWSRQGDVAPVAVTAPAASNQTLAMAPAAVQQAPAPAVVPAPAPIEPEPPQMQEAAPADEGAADWEQKLDDILLGDDDENGKADKILALIPLAPADAKQELAQHLVNMVQDDHYDGTADMLTNAATPVEVSDVLMNDLLNRNNNLKLPMLLAIARNDTHPLKDQALDLLGLLTQEDDGTNWDQWSTTIDTWLQNNPQ
jgi:hypothetical protein